MDSYTSDQARWEAYQFSDPFATNAYLCCNKKHQLICRPNCDCLPKVTGRDEIEFYTALDDCLKDGFSLCSHCDASDPSTQLDTDLIKQTIDSINHSIGFLNEGENKRRAYSVPSVRRVSVSTERQVTRNESEHIKLVELACRHIASAASSYKLEEAETVKGSKKKRRGGVLGFKELASKSKLSPWHFHRVFKSITGLTPKSYGDQCWKFIKERERPSFGHSRRGHFKNNEEITSSFRDGRKKRTKSISLAPRPATPPQANLTSNQQVSPFSVDSTKYQMPPSQLNYSNKNSLDINANFTPFRHHSLDLSNMMDVSEFNTSMFQFSPSPYLAGTNQQFQQPFNQTPGSLSLSTNSSNQQINMIPLINNNYVHSNIIENNKPAEFNDFYINNADVQIDENKWPNVQASTPEDLNSKLLTPPASVSDNDLKFKIAEGLNNGYNNYTVTENYNNNEQSFYDVLRTSSWEDDEVDIQQNFGLTNENYESMNNIDIY